MTGDSMIRLLLNITGIQTALACALVQKLAMEAQLKMVTMCIAKQISIKSSCLQSSPWTHISHEHRVPNNARVPDVHIHVLLEPLTFPACEVVAKPYMHFASSLHSQSAFRLAVPSVELQCRGPARLQPVQVL